MTQSQLLWQIKPPQIDRRQSGSSDRYELLREGSGFHLFISASYVFVVSPIFNSADFLFTLDPNKIAVKTTKTPQVSANINISSAILRVYILPPFLKVLEHRPASGRTKRSVTNWVKRIQEPIVIRNIC